MAHDRMIRGEMREWETPTVYVVRWDDGVAKVGHSVHPAIRIRDLRRHGAKLEASASGDRHLERQVITVMADLGERAFLTRLEAFGRFGGGTSGFTECYRLTDAAFAEFMEWFERATADG